MSQLHRLSEVTEFVKYILYSDYVVPDEDSHEVAISAIIVANAESGKTSVIDQFLSNNGLLAVSDLTAWGLQHRYLDELKQGKVRILIPDFINPTNRKAETVNTLVTFLNSYISWEGVRSIQTFAMQIDLTTPIKGSLLTTMATEDYRRFQKGLAAVGFLSRLLIVHYEYKQESIEEILLDIAHRKDRWSKIKLAFPDSPQVVDISDELNERLIPEAKRIGANAKVYGYRALHHLIVLAKSCALSEGRDMVTAEDVDRLNYLTPRLLREIVQDEPTPETSLANQVKALLDRR